mgnify:CR=1 FL=1
MKQNEPYNWDNFSRDLAWAEGRLENEEDEIIDVDTKDSPPKLDSGDNNKSDSV